MLDPNCKPYIIKHRLGGRTEYIKFDSHNEYYNWMDRNKNKVKGFEYYEFCHKNDFFNKLRIYGDGLKFIFSVPKEIKK